MRPPVDPFSSKKTLQQRLLRIAITTLVLALPSSLVLLHGPSPKVPTQAARPLGSIRVNSATFNSPEVEAEDGPGAGSSAADPWGRRGGGTVGEVRASARSSSAGVNRQQQLDDDDEEDALAAAAAATIAAAEQEEEEEEEQAGITAAAAAAGVKRSPGAAAATATLAAGSGTLASDDEHEPAAAAAAAGADDDEEEQEEEDDDEMGEDEDYTELHDEEEDAEELAFTAKMRAAAKKLADEFPWWDTSLSVDERVEALLARMSPQQKAEQLQSRPRNGIKWLEVPRFNWQIECLHGAKVGTAGKVTTVGGTIYPVNIAWAATFDHELAQRAASQIGDEMRAQYNRRVRGGSKRLAYTNCFGPHVHIVRDPRWGRMAETFGEDPLLQSNMAVAHVTGIQGGSGNATYIKVVATCKHFIGNDLEGWMGFTRHNFDAQISPQDMRDTFLPPFEACVREGNAGAFMCSYNAVNGLPSCVNKQLLTDTLRGEMGFKGLVVTDCTALTRMVQPRPDGPFIEGGDKRKASAKALKAGTDMACHEFDRLNVRDVSQDELDTATRRVLRARIRQGHFNPLTELPFPQLDDNAIGHPDHKATAREMAAKACVLLKNNEKLLPLRPEKLSRVAVIGPFANQSLHILGKYYGATAGPVTTPLQAFTAALPNATVIFDPSTALEWSESNIQTDIDNCQSSDVCILMLGSRMSRQQSQWSTFKFSKHAYDTLIEGEGHDRITLKLQSEQTKLWQTLAARTTKPLVVVLVHGGPLDVSDMHESPRVGAILTAWHPGQHGSHGVADILFGKVAPSGRVPVTFYKDSYTRLNMTDTRMRASGDYPGRTYRYWKGEEPLYPFGYGLSYVNFSLTTPKLAVSAPTKTVAASITVQNRGTMAADTSVLVFMSYLGAEGSQQAPAVRATLLGSGCSQAATSTDLVHRLVAYQRSGLLAGGSSKRLTFSLQLTEGSKSSWAGFGDPEPPCGAYALRFGWDQPIAAALVLA